MKLNKKLTGTVTSHIEQLMMARVQEDRGVCPITLSVASGSLFVHFFFFAQARPRPRSSRSSAKTTDTSRRSRQTREDTQKARKTSASRSSRRAAFSLPPADSDFFFPNAYSTCRVPRKVLLPASPFFVVVEGTCFSPRPRFPAARAPRVLQVSEKTFPQVKLASLVVCFCISNFSDFFPNSVRSKGGSRIWRKHHAHVCSRPAGARVGLQP